MALSLYFNICFPTWNWRGTSRPANTQTIQIDTTKPMVRPTYSASLQMQRRQIRIEKTREILYKGE